MERKDRMKIKLAYEQFVKSSAQRYSRTLGKALGAGEVEPLLGRIASGKETLDVLDMACGKWIYVHEVSKMLSGFFPGKRIRLVGADPGVDQPFRIERMARIIAGESGSAELIEHAAPLFQSRDVYALRETAGVSGFDLIISFNYLPLIHGPHLSSEKRERLRELMEIPPSIQAMMFFACMRTLLDLDGLAVVVASTDFPYAERLMRESALDIVFEEGNDEENRDFPLNERIAVARAGRCDGL